MYRGVPHSNVSTFDQVGHSYIGHLYLQTSFRRHQVDFSASDLSFLEHRGYHIRLYHLVIGSNTLECSIWFCVRLHQS